MPAFQVALTSANTNYHLVDLVKAIDANFVDRGEHITVQSDPGNASAKIRIGYDSNLSDTRFGRLLATSDVDTLPGPAGAYHLRGLYARSDTAGSKVNINIARG